MKDKAQSGTYYFNQPMEDIRNPNGYLNNNGYLFLLPFSSLPQSNDNYCLQITHSIQISISIGSSFSYLLLHTACRHMMVTRQRQSRWHRHLSHSVAFETYSEHDFCPFTSPTLYQETSYHY